MHGGEAQTARDNFAALSDNEPNNEQGAIITFLKKLVTPGNPNQDLK